MKRSASKRLFPINIFSPGPPSVPLNVPVKLKQAVAHPQARAKKKEGRPIMSQCLLGQSDEVECGQSGSGGFQCNTAPY